MTSKVIFKVLKVVLICISIGLSFGTYLYFAYDHQVSRILTSVIFSTSIGSLMMLVIYCRRYFTFFTAMPSVKAAIMIASLILAALIGSEISLYFKSLFFGPAYQFFKGESVYILNIIIALVAGIPMYVSEESREMVNLKVLNQQYRLLQLEQQNTIFELELLRAKINPHFLYNVHNSIAGLISKDPQKAEKMVLLLSKFFRFTLNKPSATYHTIADEIDIIKTYLELQSIRYEERLNYNIIADDNILNLQMPSFILQPLVENSIKHGIEKRSGKGSLVVTIGVFSEIINIKVADTGADFPQLPGVGTGLQSINNKLRILYKENFKMNFSNSPKHVEIIFPKGN